MLQFCGKLGEIRFNQLSVMGVEGKMFTEESVVNTGPLN